MKRIWIEITGYVDYSSDPDECQTTEEFNKVLNKYNEILESAGNTNGIHLVVDGEYVYLPKWVCNRCVFILRTLDKSIEK